MARTQNTTAGSTSEPADMSRALAQFLGSYPAFVKTDVLGVLRGAFISPKGQTLSLCTVRMHSLGVV